MRTYASLFLAAPVVPYVLTVVGVVADDTILGQRPDVGYGERLVVNPVERCIMKLYNNVDIYIFKYQWTINLTK